MVYRSVDQFVRYDVPCLFCCVFFSKETYYNNKIIIYYYTMYGSLYSSIYYRFIVYFR